MATQFGILSRLFATAAAVLAATCPGHSEDVTFLCASALRPAMDQLVAEFQRTNSHRVNIVYANVGAITKRVLGEEHIDLSVTSPEQWDSLHKQDKIAPDFKVTLAKVGTGFAVSKGTTILDLSSPEAVKRALLAARAVAFADPALGAPSGKDALELFARLDIATQMQSKSKLFPGTAQAIQAVAAGEADLGIMHTSVIAASPKVALAGALPGALQHFTVYVASIPKVATQPGPAKAFATFLTSPHAIAAFKAKGLDPG